MSIKLLDATEWSGKALSGEWRALDGGHLDVIEPATGQPIGGVSKATPADIRIACGAALQAQPGWAVLPYAERAKVFRRAAELLGDARPKPPAMEVDVVAPISFVNPLVG